MLVLRRFRPIPLSKAVPSIRLRQASTFATSMTKTVTVDVVSDTVCPWCFVGKKRLEVAMAEMKEAGVNFEVRWHPYQLNPHASTKGENKMAMYNEKFGTERVAQMLPMMTKTYADMGERYSMGGLTGNSLDSHRLIHWAGKMGGAELQNKVVEELFRNYFCEEKFINDPAVLVAAAEKAGLKGAAEYLADPTNSLEEVQQDMASRNRGISGVPNFTIADRYTLSGAQEPAAFVEIFRKALAE